MTLRGKLLTFTVAIVGMLMIPSLIVLHDVVEDEVERDVEEDLAKTEAVFRSFVEERTRWLRSQPLVVARDPSFRAMLDIPGSDFEQHAATVLREAAEFQGILAESGLFLVTDSRGRTLARVELIALPDQDLSSMPGMRQALAGEETVANWHLGQRTLAVATVPVYDGDERTGTLSVGFAVNGEELDEERLLEDLSSTAREQDLVKSMRPDHAVLATSQVRKVQREYSSDLTALSDATGTSVASYLRTESHGEDLSNVARFREALQADVMEPEPTVEADHGRLFQTNVVPVWTEDRVVGTLATRFEFDASLAHDLRRLTHSEVSFALGGQVVASTLSEAGIRALEERISDPASGITPGTHFRVALEGENHLSLLGQLEGTDGVYVIQSSLDQATEFLTDLEGILVILGCIILLAATLISFFAIGRIGGPLRGLVEGTRRLAVGDLNYRIDVRSRDEVGELASSFNDMSSALSRSLEALRESASQYRDLFDNARDMVYTTDLDMNLTSMNKAGIALTGYSEEELMGKSFYKLLSPEDAAALKKTEERLDPGQPRHPFEVVIVCKDASRVTLEVLSRWVLREGHAVGIHGVARDISVRRERERMAQRLREQLHQTEKLRALGEMAAGVAHNFNNLLTGIMGHAELITLADDAPRSVQEDAHKIVEWAQRCAAVVRRIGTFGRPSDMEQKEKIHLPRLVRDTVELTRPKWETRPQREGRTVEIRLDLDEVPPISSNEGAWEEILSNLIFNAVDAMPQGGVIRIATRREGDRVVLAVADTGLGMDETTRQRVFEPFYTTKGPELGTGLGLSTVWGLVQSFGGEVQVDSSPGHGTCFTIRVPVAQEGIKVRPLKRGRGAVSGLRILVIDDEPASREILTRMLSKHDVTAAESGERGLDLLALGSYDVVISDWSMAGISGLEVAAEVRRRAPDSVIVLSSGWALEGTTVNRSRAIDLLLQKPIAKEGVERILGEAAQLLEERRTAVASM